MKDVSILKNNGVNLQQSLELFGDMEMYDETLTDFLGMIDNKLASLENKKTLGDMANYAIEVHALKSDAKYLGFTALSEMAYESELKSKAGDIMFVQENHPKIIAETKKMIDIAKKYLASNVAQGQVQSVPQQPMMNQGMPQQQMVMQGMPQGYVQTPMPQGYVQSPMMKGQPVQGYAQVPMGQPVMQGQMPVQGQMPQQQMVAQPQAQPQQPVTNDLMDQSLISQGKSISGETVQFYSTDNSQNDVQIQFLPVDDVYGPQQKSTYGNGEKEGIILIVDDSILIVNFIRRIFEKKYDVLVAADGAAAIEIVDKDEIRKDIKACLLDLNMPNVNGFEVLEHFKQKGYFVRMPVAIESAVEDSESIEKASTYPVVDILTKPFNERDVQRVIEKCLATYF